MIKHVNEEYIQLNLLILTVCIVTLDVETATETAELAILERLE